MNTLLKLFTLKFCSNSQADFKFASYISTAFSLCANFFCKSYFFRCRFFCRVQVSLCLRTWASNIYFYQYTSMDKLANYYYTVEWNLTVRSKKVCANELKQNKKCDFWDFKHPFGCRTISINKNKYSTEEVERWTEHLKCRV